MYDIEAELEKEDECVFLPDGNHQQQLSALAPQTVERGGCCHCLLDQQGGVKCFHGKALAQDFGYFSDYGMVPLQKQCQNLKMAGQRE